MNARAKLSPVATELAKVTERLQSIRATKMKRVAEREPLQSKCNEINNASATIEEFVESALDHLAEIGDRWVDQNIAGFLSRFESVSVLVDQTTILTEIDSSGAHQYYASREALAFALSQPEARPRVKAKLMATLRPIEGSMSRSEKAALLAPLSKRLVALDAEIEAIDSEIAELTSLAPREAA